MPIILKSDKTTVQPGQSIVFTIIINEPNSPNVTGITLSLLYRQAGAITWTIMDTRTVALNDLGYYQGTVTKTAVELGQFEAMARGIYLAYPPMDSAILTITVSAVPTCSSYMTQTTCEAAGCYWYNNVCNSSPQPPPPPFPLLILAIAGIFAVVILSSK